MMWVLLRKIETQIVISKLKDDDRNVSEDSVKRYLLLNFTIIFISYKVLIIEETFLANHS